MPVKSSVPWRRAAPTELLASDKKSDASPSNHRRFVKWLREQPAFARIPVFIWTGSLPCKELERILEAGANGHHAKTAEFKTLCGHIQAILAHLPL